MATSSSPVAPCIRMLKTKNHQYSERRARPSKTAYFEKQTAIACWKPIGIVSCAAGSVTSGCGSVEVPAGRQLHPWIPAQVGLRHLVGAGQGTAPGSGGGIVQRGEAGQQVRPIDQPPHDEV